MREGFRSDQSEKVPSGSKPLLATDATDREGLSLGRLSVKDARFVPSKLSVSLPNVFKGLFPKRTCKIYPFDTSNSPSACQSTILCTTVVYGNEIYSQRRV